MARFYFSNKAVEDLGKIWDYSYEIWSEAQADNYYNAIIENCEFLSENPGKGKNYKEIESDVFGFKVNCHIVFYRLIGSNEIEIIRILHGRMDL